MVSNQNLANAVGGKTARACDSCIKKRARWYCPADDAFLCQACNSSVHSANPLARRHERVRLQTSSSFSNSVPSWHQGFTKKPRTPRNGKRKPKSEQSARISEPLVPELGSGETSNEENYEDQKLPYRVPVCDPFETSEGYGSEVKHVVHKYGHGAIGLHGLFVPSETELAEFAADVESLLGKGFEDESFDMEALGLLENCRETESVEGCSGEARVKVEDDTGDVIMASHFDSEIEPFELNFDYDSSAIFEEENKTGDIGRVGIMEEEGEGEFSGLNKKKEKILLRLDYEAVVRAWADQRSPWTGGGGRPELGPSECWPHCTGFCGKVHHHSYGDVIRGTGLHGTTAMADGGREARVSRYREKRRTRLFSKKIRYEVRKLNAEKRPRMKGRFVKRASFAATSAFPLLGK